MLIRISGALLVALTLTSSGPARANTLYADLGGASGVESLVKRAVDIWTSDKRVAATFEDTNLTRLKRLLVEQICALSGGGCSYSGRSMVESHKGLNLRTMQFNAVAEDLQTAMEQQGIPFSTQNRLIALLAPMQREVVAP